MSSRRTRPRSPPVFRLETLEMRVLFSADSPLAVPGTMPPFAPDLQQVVSAASANDAALLDAANGPNGLQNTPSYAITGVDDASLFSIGGTPEGLTFDSTPDFLPFADADPASALAAMPLWRPLDQVPILISSGDRRQEDDRPYPEGEPIESLDGASDSDAGEYRRGA